MLKMTEMSAQGPLSCLSSYADSMDQVCLVNQKLKVASYEGEVKDDNNNWYFPASK